MVDIKVSSKQRNKHKRSHRHRQSDDGDEEYLIEHDDFDEKKKHRTKCKEYDEQIDKDMTYRRSGRDNHGHVKIYYDLDELEYSPKYSAKHRDRHRARHIEEYGFEEYVADEIISQSKKHKSDRYRLQYDLEDEEYFTNDSADYRDTSDYYNFNGRDGEKIIYPSKRYKERHEDRFGDEYIVDAEDFIMDAPTMYKGIRNQFDGVEYSDRDEIIYEPERQKKRQRHRVSFDLEDQGSENKDKRHSKYDRVLDRKGSSDTADEDAELVFEPKKHKHRVSFDLEDGASEKKERRHRKSKRRERKGSSDTPDEEYVGGFEHKEKQRSKRPGSGRKSDKKSKRNFGDENDEKRKQRRENRKHKAENQGEANKERRRLVENEYETSKDDDKRKERDTEKAKQRELREPEESRKKERSKKKHLYKQDKNYDKVRLGFHNKYFHKMDFLGFHSCEFSIRRSRTKRSYIWL